LENFDTIISIAIKDHDIGETNLVVYAEALAAWKAFFLFNDDVTKGRDDNDHVTVEAHAHELDKLDALFTMAVYLEVAGDPRVTFDMHIMACHTGDLVREWGSLMKRCSQGAEAMHQY
jgi:hypothetical protein